MSTRLVGNGGLLIDTCPPDVTALHTLVVVGGDVEAMRRPFEVAAVGQLAIAATRVAGVCTGAYLLAEAGLRLALAYAREHLAEPLPVERLAEAARLSPRQFGRAFRAETGETPAKAVERLRVEAARLRVEEGAEPVEVIARAVGFADPERMRRAFVKRFGHSPQVLRRISAPPR